MGHCKSSQTTSKYCKEWQYKTTDSSTSPVQSHRNYPRPRRESGHHVRPLGHAQKAPSAMGRQVADDVSSDARPHRLDRVEGKRLVQQTAKSGMLEQVAEDHLIGGEVEERLQFVPVDDARMYVMRSGKRRGACKVIAQCIGSASRGTSKSRLLDLPDGCPAQLKRGNCNSSGEYVGRLATAHSADACVTSANRPDMMSADMPIIERPCAFLASSFG
jgi:hypothetical protein